MGWPHPFFMGSVRAGRVVPERLRPSRMHPFGAPVVLAGALPHLVFGYRQGLSEHRDRN